MMASLKYCPPLVILIWAVKISLTVWLTTQYKKKMATDVLSNMHTMPGKLKCEVERASKCMVSTSQQLTHIKIESFNDGNDPHPD